MNLKLLHLDTSCLHCHCYTKSNIGISIVDNNNTRVNKHSRDQTLPQNPNNKFQQQRKNFYNNNNNKNGVFHESESFNKTPDREESKKIRVRPRISDKRRFGVNGGNFGYVEKVHVKCSTKWGSYGGYIPAILQALDTVKDIDEALQPWAEKLSNKERSIILKEQSCCDRALEIFEWFKQKGCYELNVIHYNIMLRVLGKSRKWSYVESLWDEMNIRGILPINSTYGTLIDLYSKGGKKDEALRWLERMNERKMEPDEVTMGIVVQMYKKLGEFEKAEDFFKKWSSGGFSRHEEVSVCLSLHTYNMLIDTYGKAGRLKEASETFSRMIGEGIAPNTITFNTLIHICGNNGQLEEISSLMKKMEELRVPPDTRTYNILIFLHAKRNDINTATKYFKKMKAACLQPDLVSYRTLLYAYSIRRMVGEAEELIRDMDEKSLTIDEYTQSALTRMYIESGKLEKAWTWFRRFHLTGNMSSDCYSANIDAYGERGYIFEAEKVFNCCKTVEKLTVVEFNVMIKAYGIAKNYEKACELFNSMESYHIVPDSCSYSSIIQILASADLAVMAIPYLKRMQEFGLVNDCVPYCAVISSFVKLGNLEKVEEIYEEMIGNNVNPDIILFGVLINAFADAGSVKKASSYIDAMKRAGLPGNPVIYNSLIKLYTKVGYLREAQEIYKLLQFSGHGPDTYSANCMIDLYSRQSMNRPAEEIFETAKKKQVANEFSYSMMLCMYKKLGMFEEASRIAKQMRELGLLTDLLSYNNVLGLFAMDGRYREAVGTFKEMIKESICPDDCTFKLLGIILIKCGVPKKAVAKLETVMKKDFQCGLQSWLSALSSVVEMCTDSNEL
ncbi:hypothetical protein ACFE04_014262 [Oxalis oulophora]